MEYCIQRLIKNRSVKKSLCFPPTHEMKLLPCYELLQGLWNFEYETIRESSGRKVIYNNCRNFIQGLSHNKNKLKLYWGSKKLPFKKINMRIYMFKTETAY